MSNPHEDQSPRPRSTPTKLSGYIESVGDVTNSASSTNSYFQVTLRTAPNYSESIRVMESPTVKRQLFADKFEINQPVTLVKMNETPNGVIFYNSNLGSKMYDDNTINFEFKRDTLITSLKSLQDKTKGSFTIRGYLHWLSEEKSIEMKQKYGKVTSPTKRRKRDALISDATGYLPISIWEEQLSAVKEKEVLIITDVKPRFYLCKRLETSVNSKITVTTADDTDVTPDWDELKANYNQMLKKGSSVLVNPKVLSVIVNEYYKCSQAQCGKRLGVVPGKQSTRCQHCKRLVDLEECEKTKHANVTFRDAEKSTYDLTIFTNVLNTFFDKHLKIEDLEEKILFLKDVTVTFNNKKVVTEIAKN